MGEIRYGVKYSGWKKQKNENRIIAETQQNKWKANIRILRCANADRKLL